MKDDAGATAYHCMTPKYSSEDGASFAFFTSRGAKEVFDRKQSKSAASNPGDGMEVVGPENWIVWGNAQEIIVKAIDLGGTQSY
jgi:hypothetical protein